MSKIFHEFRDPIHVFIRLKTEERALLDSPFFQRLRHIHQLATTYLVYPGATHKRFEHSLGVMELATRIYDIVTDPNNLHPKIQEQFTNELHNDRRVYWRMVLRIAALFHDIGHLPFSHAAEKELFPDNYTHENMTVDIIKSPEMKEIFDTMRPAINIDDIAKVAVGPKELKEEDFTSWITVLSEIITGDVFGADRIDYLLRDSHHTGVAYGKFDHYRLIDTLRILPKGEGDSLEPVLGIERGGIHSAEALLLARYFMFEQLYFHRVRRAYDIHLKDFMIEWFGDERFPCTPNEFVKITDNEIMYNIANAARNNKEKGHAHAKRIMDREHFRVLWKKNPDDLSKNPEAGDAIFKKAQEQFGSDSVRRDKYDGKNSSIDFPVLNNDQTISTYVKVESDAINKMLTSSFDYVFIDKKKLIHARRWLQENLEDIIKLEEEGE